MSSVKNTRSLKLPQIPFRPRSTIDLRYPSAIDMLCSGRLGQLSESDIETQEFLQNFEEGSAPAAFTDEERKEWLGQLNGVALSSDAFVS